MAAKSLRLALAAALLLAIIAVAGVYFARRDGNKNFISTTGIVEAEEANLSSEISARVVSIKFREGERIEKGRVAIALESDDLLASVRQAEAATMRAGADINAASSSLNSLKADIKSAEADISRESAGVEASEARLREAKRQLDRAEGLYNEKLIPTADLDLKTTGFETSAAEFEAAKAGLQGANSRLDALRARIETERSLVEAAIAKKKEAEAALSYHKARLGKTEIKSPISGTVVFGHAEEGETVSAGAAILTIADLENLWVRVDIEETLLGGLRLGDRAVIRLSGGKTLRAEISEIGRYAEFATQRDVIRGRQDIKTFRVKLRAEDTAGALKPGMTVEVELPKR